MKTQKRVAFTTLGCKLNFSETSDIANQFEKAGYLRVEDEEPSDIFVINTCTVTELANKKSKQAIRKVINHNPKAIIVAVGCYTQLKPEEVARIDGIDLILGSDNKNAVVEEVEKITTKGTANLVINKLSKETPFVPSYSFGDRTRSFLKVQDGCDYYCSYCAIPNARGRSRNNSIELTVEKATEIVSKGVKEIILTGVNIGDFGKSTGETFFDLIKALENLPGLERLRISSIEPNLLTDEILERVSHSKVVVPHFHIPLQCGTNRLLQLMKRRYTTSLYQKKIETIKRLMSDACIAADVIVGIPGETEEEFEQTVQFIRSIDVSYLHIFTYSERENTLAVKMDQQVPVEIRKKRSKLLHNVAREKQRYFHQQHLGTIRSVLFEATESNGLISGFTDNYIKVELPFKAELINTTQWVRLIKINKNDSVLGELINT